MAAKPPVQSSSPRTSSSSRTSRSFAEARIQAAMLLKQASGCDVAAQVWAHQRFARHPGVARAAARKQPLRLQMKHAMHVIALEWGYADWAALRTELTASARAAMRRVHGAWANGYTSEDVARVAAVVRDWTGIELAVVWALADQFGTGGDSNVHSVHRVDPLPAAHASGAAPAIVFGPCPDALWAYLCDDDATTLDAEGWQTTLEALQDLRVAPYSPTALRDADLPDHVIRCDRYNYVGDDRRPTRARGKAAVVRVHASPTRRR